MSYRHKSALDLAFSPGFYPFKQGSIAEVAGALAYYLAKSYAFKSGNKKIAVVVATTFMQINDYDLNYVFDAKKGHNELVNVIKNCAADALGIDGVKRWFEEHKRCGDMKRYL